MKTATALVMGIEAFTLLNLLKKVAAYKGLEIQDGASRAYSEPIRMYTLDNRLLAALAERGIRRKVHPEFCNDETFTLVDENSQESVSGRPSNGWSFRLIEGSKHRFDLRVFLSIGLQINAEKRGVVFWPQAHGTSVSGSDQLPHFRMFKALIEIDTDAPAFAKELAASNGSIVVTWTDLGLGGIRKLTDLFNEFAGTNETVKRLGNQEVFDPVPNPRYQQPCDELFIIETAQPRVIQTWRTQLYKYRDSLIL